MDQDHKMGDDSQLSDAERDAKCFKRRDEDMAYYMATICIECKFCAGYHQSWCSEIAVRSGVKRKFQEM